MMSEKKMSQNKWLLLGDSDSEEILYALERYLDGKAEVKVGFSNINSSNINSSKINFPKIKLAHYSKVLVYLNSQKIKDFSEPEEIYQELLKAIFKVADKELPPFIFLSTERNLTYKGNGDFKGYEWCYLLYEAVGSQYIHLPKQLDRLKDLLRKEKEEDKRKEKEEDSKNPLRIFGEFKPDRFKKYEKVSEKNGKPILPGKLRYLNGVIEFYCDVSRFHLGEEDYRRKLSHDLVNLDKWETKVLEGAAQTKLFAYFDLIWALSQKRRFPMLKGEINILVVDNNLRDDVKEDLQEIEEYFGWKFWQVGQDKSGDFFGDLLEKIKKKEKIKVKRPKCKEGEEEEGEEKTTIDSFNLILQDLYLCPDMKGDDFLPLYLEHYPHIPIFVYSGSEDSEVINHTLKRGADYYLFKTRTLALPKALLNYYERLGELLLLFEEEHYRDNLIGNIRYWNFKKDFLWFGDKCYHMVNHSFNHTLNGWQNANKLLYPIFKEKGLKSKGNPEGLMTPEDLYCLSMAIWLHDIGHRGNQRYGEPHLIRDNHGVISGELILSQPHLFNIEDKKDENLDDYRGMTFPLGHAEVPAKKPVTQVIQEKIQERGLTILEKIALICIYHKSNAPITKDDYRKMLSKGKYIPLDFYQKSDKNEEVITLEDIIKNDKGEYFQGGEDLESIVALFRFIDGLDVNKVRVGDLNEENLKGRVIEQDKNYQLEKLKNKVDLLSKAKFEDDMQRVFFKKIFYQDIKDKIEKGEPIGSLEIPGVTQNLAEELNDYIMLVNYAQFISVQDGHFSLHSSIENIEIVPHKEDSKRIQIHYISNSNESFLTESKLVREYHEKEAKTISVHLIGQKKGKEWQDGYVLKELNVLKKYLEKKVGLKIERIALWGMRVGGENGETGVEKKEGLRCICGCKKESKKWVEWILDKPDIKWEDYKKDPWS